MAEPMRGSGIYENDYTDWFFCSHCDEEMELDGKSDDYGVVATAECPKCLSTLEVEMPSKEQLRENYLADYDPNN